ncbi:NAD-dependent epimerase/dehydratase family protein [Mangrovibacillus cuniculi]|uniref:NAD-dependent epimerase/dehydratase family protein n=1 Tax=Mangrovibacillus cuniculi TaxID=2593652 RepID=A0A7S8HEW8_9BACI|nr:NAD-dependent epimerase/dehydratase family protein [Mangrovibacillus cuniculi]QPC46193.1 NAD-dependent epimerase/dehydratase family protein [Mangrovibacillus cuniculi]
MKKVLVLGGTSFFGKRLVQLLIDEGKEVTIATRGRTQDSFGETIKRLTIDREDKSSLIQAFKGRQWDVVYDQSCFSPVEMRYSCDALKDKVKRYVFTSTMAVYEFGIQRKEDEFNPNTYTYIYKNRGDYKGYEGYQEAKRAAEAHLFTQTDFDSVAVRFPIVVGKDDYTNRLKNHVMKVKNNQDIGIESLQNRYSFILSKEAAKFLYHMGESTFIGPINAGAKNDISMDQLITKIEEILKKEARVTTAITSENVSPYALGGSWSIHTGLVNSLGMDFSDCERMLEELISYYVQQEV